VVVVCDCSSTYCGNEGDGPTGDGEGFGVDVDVHGFEELF
jgi:hypothetical protein